MSTYEFTNAVEGTIPAAFTSVAPAAVTRGIGVALPAPVALAVTGKSLVAPQWISVHRDRTTDGTAMADVVFGQACRPRGIPL
jgi:hypothetical protein